MNANASALLAGLLAWGCGDSTASTTPDASSSMDAASNPTSCAPFTGAAPTVSAAPQCHDLANAAPEIGTTIDPGTIPTGTGGTISDGLYYLTEVRLYAGSPIAAGYRFQQTYLVKNGKSYLVERTNT